MLAYYDSVGMCFERICASYALLISRLTCFNGCQLNLKLGVYCVALIIFNTVLPVVLHTCRVVNCWHKCFRYTAVYIYLDIRFNKISYML